MNLKKSKTIFGWTVGSFSMEGDGGRGGGGGAG